MDTEDAIGLLPEPYQEAIRLERAGLGHLIPERLEIPAEAVGPLFEVAKAKLASLLERHEDINQ